MNFSLQNGRRSLDDMVPNNSWWLLSDYLSHIVQNPYFSPQDFDPWGKDTWLSCSKDFFFFFNLLISGSPELFPFAKQWTSLNSQSAPESNCSLSLGPWKRRHRRTCPGMAQTGTTLSWALSRGLSQTDSHMKWFPAANGMCLFKLWLQRLPCDRPVLNIDMYLPICPQDSPLGEKPLWSLHRKAQRFTKWPPPSNLLVTSWNSNRILVHNLYYRDLFHKIVFSITNWP